MLFYNITMVIAYYRYTPGDNSPHRPKWFSKELCLKSFVYACRKFVKKYPNSLKIIFAIDKDWVFSVREKLFFKKYCNNRFAERLEF